MRGMSGRAERVRGGKAEDAAPYPPLDAAMKTANWASKARL